MEFLVMRADSSALMEVWMIRRSSFSMRKIVWPGETD